MLLQLYTSLLAATERQNGPYELLCLAFRQAWDLIEVRAIKGLTDISIILILSWLMFVRSLLLRVLYPDVSMDFSYSCKMTMAMRHMLNICATVEHRVPVASTCCTVCCLIAQEGDSYVQLSSAAAVLTAWKWVFQTSSSRGDNDEAATVARLAREARWRAAPCLHFTRSYQMETATT